MIEGAANVFFLEEKTDQGLLLAAIAGFIEGIEPNAAYTIDEEVIVSILRGMRRDFPAKGGLNEASAFKKVANFFCYFVGKRPISGGLSESKIGSLSRTDNHLNVMVAFHLCVRLLHNATINDKTSGELEQVVLKNEISLSKHSYGDVIDACKSVTPSSHFLLIAVLFEQLVYRANPDVSNSLVT